MMPPPSLMELYCAGCAWSDGGDVDDNVTPDLCHSSDAGLTQMVGKQLDSTQPINIQSLCHKLEIEIVKYNQQVASGHMCLATGDNMLSAAQHNFNSHPGCDNSVVCMPVGLGAYESRNIMERRPLSPVPELDVSSGHTPTSLTKHGGICAKMGSPCRGCEYHSVEDLDETIVAPPSPGVVKQPVNMSSSMSAPAAPGGGNFPMGALLSSAMAAAVDKDDDNAQSILEEHVSRIWDSSNGQTPSRSPGRQSPDRTDRSFRYPPPPGPSPNVSGTNLNTSHTSHLAPPKGVPHHRRRGEKDPPNAAMLSSSSFDSGMGEDRSGVYFHEPENSRHKHVYHYHHHHHHIPKDSKGRPVIDHEAQSRMQYYINPALRNHSDSLNISGTGHAHAREESAPRGHSARDTRKSAAKKVSDSSSNFDSGVSLAWDMNVPNLHDPANEKVMSWMLENDKMTTSNPQYSTDGSDKGSSHKRSSHKSSSNTSQHKSISSGKSKAPVQYNASRSGSLDRGTYPSPSLSHSFTAGVGGTTAGLPVGTGISPNLSFGGVVQPTQPFAQDPSMPLLNPPNPTTQLEEAKRRLEDESNKVHLRAMLKSKSFTGAFAKDRRAMPPPSQAVIPPRSLPTHTATKNIPQTAPLDLSSSEDHSSHGSYKSDSRKPSKKPVSAPTTPGSQPDTTVVGYYLGSEPIPYRTNLPGRNITLAQFKPLISKKGNYRYFFKTASDDFESGVVHEEVTEDSAILPLWDGKIIGKIEKVECL